MHAKKLPWVILIMAMVFLSVSFCHADEWELIGERKVQGKDKFTDIEIGGQGIRYQKIRFGVKNTALRIRSVIAYTADGEKKAIDFSSYIKKGEFTSPISFFERGIELVRVRLIYRTKKHVIVQLYGIKGAN